jgi:hypothetical protein
LCRNGGRLSRGRGRQPFAVCPAGADEAYVFFHPAGAVRVRVEALALRETIERFAGKA